jgi:hypothetical protein
MLMDPAQRFALAMAIVLTSLVLELALALDWGQELTGWSVAAVICLTFAAKALLHDRHRQHSPTSPKRN